MGFSIRGAEGHQNTDRSFGINNSGDGDFENILNDLLEAKLGKDNPKMDSKLDSKELDKLTERLSTAGLSSAGTVSSNPETFIKKLKEEGRENSIKSQYAPGFESYGLDLLS